MTNNHDENTEARSALLERNSDKMQTAFREGTFGSAVSGAVSGALGGMIAGRGAGKRAAQRVTNQQPQQPQQPMQVPQHPQGVIGPKPANMPTNNQSDNQPQSKSSSMLGKAAQGIGNVIKGGVQKAQQAKQQQTDTNAFLNDLGSGAAAQQNSIQSPEGASQYVDSVINAFNTISNLVSGQGPQSQQETNLALAWFEYAHLTEKALSDSELLNAIKGFSDMVKGKSAVELSDKERQTLLRLTQSIPDLGKALRRFPHVLADENVKVLTNTKTAETLSQALQTLQTQQSKLNANTKPAKLNGAIANAIKGIDNSQMQSLLNATRLIINKYGQVEDFTVYSWSDLQDLVEALKEFGSTVDIDLSGIQDPDNTTPAGKAPAVKQEPQAQQDSPQQADQQTAQESPAAAGDSVGQIVQQMRNDPEMIKQLVQYAIEKNADNKDRLLKKYGIEADVLE